MIIVSCVLAISLTKRTFRCDVVALQLNYQRLKAVKQSVLEVVSNCDCIGELNVISY